MKYVQRKRHALLAQQSGQIQLLIIAPILTLSFLSLVVRTASSAIDPALEKKKITQQLKQRLSEVRKSEEPQSTLEARSREESRPSVQVPNPSRVCDTERLWQVVNDQHQLKVSLTPVVTVAVPSASTKAENIQQVDESWPTAQVHNIEQVRKAIEGQAKKKTSSSSSVILAAASPVPLSALPPVKRDTLLSPLPQKIVRQIKKKDTLEKIFKEVGLPPEKTAQWLKAAKKLKEFRTLRPGNALELSFTDEEENCSLKVLFYEIDEGSRLVLESKTSNNIETIESRRETIPSQQVWYVVGGRIETSLYKAAMKAGLPARIVDGLADMDWDFDLSSDLHPGDTFKVIIEAVQRGEKIVEYKRLLAAEIFNTGKVLTVFSIPEENPVRGEDNSEGIRVKSGGQQFLRYPLQFTRISSVFTDARLHPILGRVRPHTGVDFAAPRGAPVRSVADGVITFAGRQAGYGNIIRINHPGPYDTAYAHLQGFAKGVREGVPVERGQVIGYVGSTGLATGPHLHFELYRDGEFVNPLTAKLSENGKGVQEKKKLMENPVVTAMKRRLTEQLAALQVGKKPASLVIALAQDNMAADNKITTLSKQKSVASASSRRTSSGRTARR